MIMLTIKCKNQIHREDVIDRCNSALVGSPGYINNEILVGKDPDSLDVLMLIGTEGVDNMDLTIDGEEIIISRSE